jgi:hypothetical protein
MRCKKFYLRILSTNLKWKLHVWSQAQASEWRCMTNTAWLIWEWWAEKHDIMSQSHPILTVIPVSCENQSTKTTYWTNLGSKHWPDLQSPSFFNPHWDCPVAIATQLWAFSLTQLNLPVSQTEYCSQGCSIYDLGLTSSLFHLLFPGGKVFFFVKLRLFSRRKPEEIRIILFPFSIKQNSLASSLTISPVVSHSSECILMTTISHCIGILKRTLECHILESGYFHISVLSCSSQLFQ